MIPYFSLYLFFFIVTRFFFIPLTIVYVVNVDNISFFFSISYS